MSKDKYMRLFLCKIEAIVFIILQIFCNAFKIFLQIAYCMQHGMISIECSLV